MMLLRILIGLISLNTALWAADPSLDINGAKLANRVTGWALRNTPADKRAQTRDLGDIFAHMNFAWQFQPPRDPGRVHLKLWMNRQPDHSIAPHALLEQAITIEGGNVQQGLRLSYDVLSQGWYNIPARNAYEHILKLQDITGELETFHGNSFYDFERNLEKQTIRGDNFSAWYHFMGAALTSYTRNGRVLASAAVYDSQLLHDAFVDSQKRNAIDLAGVEFGYRLRQNLEKYADPKAFERSPAGADTEYLFSNPDRYGPEWPLKEGQLPRDFRTEAKSKKGPTMMESIARIRELGRLDDAASLAELINYVVLSSTHGPSDEEARGRDFPEVVVMQQAIRMLGRRKDPESLRLLREQLQSYHARRREEAILALAERGDPELRKFILEKLPQEYDQRARSAFFRALATLPYDEELGKLLRDQLKTTPAGGYLGAYDESLDAIAAAFSLKGAPSDFLDFVREAEQRVEEKRQAEIQQRANKERRTLGLVTAASGFVTFVTIHVAKKVICGKRFASLAPANVPKPPVSARPGDLPVEQARNSDSPDSRDGADLAEPNTRRRHHP